MSHTAILHTLRKKIVQSLWQRYLHDTTQMQLVHSHFIKQGLTLHLDHFALIDLPGPHSGIPIMEKIFALLGFHFRGQGYLPEKQNDFHWLAEDNIATLAPEEALPQIVIADFRLEEMPANIRHIITQYAEQATPFPFAETETLLNQAMSEVTTERTTEATTQLHQIFTHYLAGRNWPLPTITEFKTVQQYNELLAWVLVFGRQPNHFTISTHLLTHYKNLDDFLTLIREELHLELNSEGGIIKGTKAQGLEQASTTGVRQTIALQDGAVSLPNGFIEFIWRFAQRQPAICCDDYFTGFIAANANRVIESLYTE